METIVKFGSPLYLDSVAGMWIFILLPALFAGLGARVMQGSALRIVGGALGGGFRDFFVLAAIAQGWITVTNPSFDSSVSSILILFGAAGGALGSCLAPYRGKLLILNSALGGFLGQFCLPYILFSKRNRRAV